MRLHWKLMVTYTSVVVLVVACAHLYLDRATRTFLVGQLGDTLAREVRLAGAYLSREASDTDPPGQVDGLADFLGQQLSVRATVVDGAGRVLGDSEVGREDLVDLENHADRPEIRDAWTGRTARSQRYSTTLGQEMFYVAGVVSTFGDGRTVMRLSVPLRHVEQIQSRIRGAIWTASVLGLGLALVLAYASSWFLSRPIADAIQMARSVATGDFNAGPRAPETSTRELRDLVRALEEMRRQIQERIQQITMEKSRLEAVLASITEGILVTGRDGRVQMINGAFQKLFGIVSPTQSRMPVELMRSGAVQEAIERTMETGEEIAQNMVLPGMPERRLDVHVAPIMQVGACIGSVTVFYDNAELHRLERIRKDFVANVSHELRTPLTAIKGCAETLIDTARADPEAEKRFVQMILSHSNRLEHLLGDLLDLSRLESEKLELVVETFPLRDVAAAAVGSVMQSAQEREVTIDVELPEALAVRCDAKLVEQAVINLLDNAVKYTPEGGSIWLVARRLGVEGDLEPSSEAGAYWSTGSDVDGSRLVLEVTDTGIGIPSDSLSRVFERFYRVDKGRSRSLGGTGLGLSIVRHIVEAHGERVYVKSELGKGSTFGFTLAEA